MMSDRLKRLNNGEMAADLVCPYANKNAFMAASSAVARPPLPISARCATLGRVKNLEMTEYQRQQKCINMDAHRDYTLSLGRNHKLRRKPYSESEDYDTDTSGDTRNEVLSRPAAAAAASAAAAADS